MKAKSVKKKSFISSFKNAALVIVACFPLVSFASGNDILFIDTNNGIEEIDFVRDFLKKTDPGARLVVIPSYDRISLEKRKEIQKINAEVIIPLDKFYIEQCPSYKPAAELKSKGCEEKLNKLLAARKYVENDLKGHLLHADNIRDELEALKRNDSYQFSRLIISGHHSPADINDHRGVVGGEMMSGFSSTMAKEFLNATPSLSSVRTVMMLGCRTGEYETMKKEWSQVLPNAPVHIGYISRSPDKANRTNYEIFDIFLKNELALSQVNSTNELVQFVRSLGMNRFAGREFSFVLRDNFISSRTLKPLPL